MNNISRDYITRCIKRSAGLFLWLVSLYLSPVYGQTSQSGDIVEYIRTIREAMPGSGTNAFIIPTNSELNAFQSVVSDLKQKNYSQIQSKLTPYNYEFIKYTDTGSNKIFYILKEKLPISRGWGTYISFPTSSDSLSIEVPHPIWDTNTWLVGIKAFVRMNASWFLMAGTHRYANSDSSSDVAHVTQVVFHAAHKTIATPIAIQVHGFNRSNSIYNGYPDIVISNGTLYPPSSLFNLKTNFESKGFSAGVFSYSTYSSLWRLGATTNTQGQWSNSNGKLFVHIEFEYFIRTSNFYTDRVIQAVNESYGSTTSVMNTDNKPAKTKEPFLHQNFPNPFNNSTSVFFDLNERMTINLKVFNIIGEIIYVQNDLVYEAGRHRINLDLSGFNSGVYFIQIYNNFFSQVKKITLLK